ncbi:MAG TPA: MlaE family lipid ABC transporter permease subunit [Kofleriaceae bacterium]|nr:MlaE family lipid ABC transporter permease subunit [Kofleriaceae bacterium]
MQSPVTTVERRGRAAVVHLRGDLVVPTARDVYGKLRGVAKRRDVREVVLDFSDAGRIDSSGLAVVSLVEQQLRRHGKKLELTSMNERHRAAIELLPKSHVAPERLEQPGRLEKLGDRVLGVNDSTRQLWDLIAETVRQSWAVVSGRKRLPAGALGDQLSTMGVDGVFIVSLLSFLLGLTTAFQGAVQLQKFGAGVFVVDMIGLSMVRELAPLMTAVILTGRTGAAIAAELGTMKVRSEVDALTAMGISPVRFLIVPRLAAITLVVPMLTLIAMFVGMLGGMLVASLSLDMPAVTFWGRLTERLDLWDYSHGLAKSVVFAWIIGLAGCHLGMRAGGDASSVGSATTRTVVTSIFFIIVVDAIFATVSTLTRMS